MKIQTYYYFLLQKQKPDSWPAITKERNEEGKMKITFRKIQNMYTCEKFPQRVSQD